METIIDLGIIENDHSDHLDEIMKSLERYSLKTNDLILKDTIEKKILYLERIIQDAEEKKEKYRVSFNDISIGSLIKEYFVPVKSKTTRENFELFSKGLDSIIRLSKNAEHKDIDYFKSNVKILSPLSYLKDRGMYMVDLDNYHKASAIALTHFDIANSNWVYLSDMISEKKVKDPIEIWDMELFFNVTESETHKPMEFIYQFIEILNSIPGVKVKIESITLGSLNVKLKAAFENFTGKEEVKELLEGTKKFVKGKLEKEFEETEKTKKETEKIDLEKRLLLHELEQNKSLDSIYLRSLEIQSAEEDLKRKKLENAMLQIDLMNKGYQALSELLAKGIISQRHFELSIKGLPFIGINDGRLSMGESMDVIDKL